MFYAVLALLCTATVPALLPRERQVMVGLALLQIAALAAAAWALQSLKGETRGEGPAFATLALLYGGFQGVVLLSLLGRGMAGLLQRWLSALARSRLQRSLLVLALLLPATAVGLSATHWAGPSLVKLALLLAMPLLWMAVALGLPHPAPTTSARERR